MRSLFPPTLLIALAALGPSLAIGCKSPPGPAPSEGSTPPAASPASPDGGGGPAGKAAVPSPKYSPLGPACEDVLARLRDLDVRVPIVFAYSGRPAAEINEDVKQGIALARKFLAECSGTEPACEVKSQLARFLLARGKRHRHELESERYPPIKDSGMSPEAIEAATAREMARIDEEMAAYHGEVRTLAAAASGCRESIRARQTGLFVILKLAEEEGRLEEVRRAARELLEGGEDAPSAPSVHLAFASTYLQERRYGEAAEYLRAVIAKREHDPEYAVYNDRLFDALTGLGDLEGMEDLAFRVRAEYPGRMETIESQFLRSIYEQWYYNALFWIGFVRMALGDTEGAKSAFRESIAEVEALEARLKAQGKIINNVIKIYLDNRTRDLLLHLEERHGKPPLVLDADGGARPLDFELGRFWATGEKLTLEGSRGKVVAAVFQTKGFHDDRSRPFLQAIDRFVKEREGDGLRGVWLSFLTGKGGPEADAKALETLRAERKSLGVSLPAGYDPDRERWSLFQSIGATVGSSSFFVFDRKGRHAWYMFDPRGIDVAIARRVMARILAEEE